MSSFFQASVSDLCVNFFLSTLLRIYTAWKKWLENLEMRRLTKRKGNALLKRLDQRYSVFFILDVIFTSVCDVEASSHGHHCWAGSHV